MYDKFVYLIVLYISLLGGKAYIEKKIYCQCSSTSHCLKIFQMDLPTFFFVLSSLLKDNSKPKTVTKSLLNIPKYDMLITKKNIVHM